MASSNVASSDIGRQSRSKPNIGGTYFQLPDLRSSQLQVTDHASLPDSPDFAGRQSVQRPASLRRQTANLFRLGVRGSESLITHGKPFSMAGNACVAILSRQ